MAVLPIYFDHMESSLSAAMIFPHSPEKARAYAAWLILRDIKNIREFGAGLTDAIMQEDNAPDRLLDVALAASDFGYISHEAQENNGAAARAGFVIAILWSLIRENPGAASIEMAIDTADRYATRGKLGSANRNKFHEYLKRFRPVLHLLGASTLRQNARLKRNLENVIILVADPSSTYTRKIDLLFFVAEARAIEQDLLAWDQSRLPRSAHLSEPMVAFDCRWDPPPRRPDWPDTGSLSSKRLENAKIPPAMKKERRRPGRPAFPI
jgi:hypothetical protein